MNNYTNHATIGIIKAEIDKLEAMLKQETVALKREKLQQKIDERKKMALYLGTYQF